MVGAAPAGQPPSPRLARLLSIASVVCALIAFVPSGAWLIGQPWHTGVLEDDDALVELLIRDSASGANLVGPYSRFRWNHPGPLLFYLAWPVYALSGDKPAAARLVPLAVNMVCAIGIVGIARRYFGVTAGLAAGAGVAIIAAHLGASIVASLWNPWATIIPFALFVCLAFAMSQSGRGFIPLVVIVATFLVQTHIGYLPAVAAVLAAASLLALREAIADGAARHRGAPPATNRFRARWVAAGLATGLVLWLPPLLDQAWIEPGNLSLLWRFFTTPHPAHPLSAVFRMAAPNVSGVLLRLEPMMVGRYDEPAPSAAANALLGLLILGLLAVLVLARTRRLRVFGLLVLVSLAAALLAARRIVDDLLPYLFIWMCAIGLLGWLAVAILSIERIGALSSRTASCAILCAAAVLSLLALRSNVLFVETMRPMAPLPYVSALSDAITDAARGEVPLIDIRDETWIWSAGVLNELTRRGVAFRVPAHWTFLFGKSRLSRGGERVRFLLSDAGANADLKERRDLALVTSSNEKLVFRELAASAAQPARSTAGTASAPEKSTR